MSTRAQDAGRTFNIRQEQKLHDDDVDLSENVYPVNLFLVSSL